jgi:fructosamine-3-kinase
MTDPLIKALAQAIGQARGRPFEPRLQRPAGGGCINEALVLESGEASYFVKTNRAALAGMFAAEADGLQAIAATGTVRVPAVLTHGVTGGTAYLVLEYLELGGGTGQSAERLGRSLAALHRCPQATFGWPIDNTIGSTPQVNAPDPDWVNFFRTARLGYQLSLARERGIGNSVIRRGEQLLERLEAFFRDHRPLPSLLHGDLWGGNYSALPDGTPVIFDPAVYAGDREADIAMTELFGGFPARFYSAYREAWPVDAGYDVRRTLYNLYHILNHYNLFGGGYGGQAGRMIDALLAETG